MTLTRVHVVCLATDTPDSPHLLVPKMRGEIYTGVSWIDPYIAPGVADRLETALKEGDTNHTIEIYPGVHHCFAVPGLPIYDRGFWDRDWKGWSL